MIQQMMARHSLSDADRVTEIRIRGMRTLNDVTLKLGPLTVLIGENGAGKSTLAEACVLLGKLGGENFLDQFMGVHGGFTTLLRRGSQAIGLGLRLEGGGNPLDYDIELSSEQGQLVITSENVRLESGEKTTPVNVFQRARGTARISDSSVNKRLTISIDEGRPLVSGFGVLAPEPAISRLLTALRNIEVHVPFTTTPGWAARALRIAPLLRQSTIIEPAERLAFGGVNLANAYQALKNDKAAPGHWQETMEYVRLGLGEDVQSIDTRVDPGGGQIALALRRTGGFAPEPAFSLSDGMLSYLAFVALFRLEAPTPLLVFDEPETHLHPSLLGRVLGFFDAISEHANVLLCTHSDRLLDGLQDPALSAALIELDEQRTARVVRPDKAALAKWLEKYSGLGSLRAAGYEPVLFPKPVP